MKLVLKIAAGVLLALCIFSIPLIIRAYNAEKQREVNDHVQLSIVYSNKVLDDTRKIELSDKIDLITHHCDNPEHSGSEECANLRQTLANDEQQLKLDKEYSDEEDELVKKDLNSNLKTSIFKSERAKTN